MRIGQRRVRQLQRRLLNPPVLLALRLAGRLRVAPRHFAVLETVGRRSGRPRTTPVGVHRAGDVVWVVAEHGHHADYVRNLEAEPRVRLLVGGRWSTGRARVVPDDDPGDRLARCFGRTHRAAVRRFATSPLSVRIDLDPE